MVGKPRQVMMDMRMSACPSGGPVGVPGRNKYFISSIPSCPVAPQVTLNMNSHPPVLDTVSAKSSSNKGGTSRGENQWWNCFRSVYNFMKSGSQTPVTWVNPGYVSQFQPSLLQEANYSEAPYVMPETSTGQNMPLWYPATPGSNMDYQEPLQSIFYHNELPSHYKVFPDHRGGLSKPSKPLNPEAKEWIPSNFQINKSNSVSSTPPCSLSSTNVQNPLIIATSLTVGFVEITDEEINEVRNKNNIQCKNSQGNVSQNLEGVLPKNVSQNLESVLPKNLDFIFAQSNKNHVAENTQLVETQNNMKNEILKNSFKSNSSDLSSSDENLETRHDEKCTKVEENLSNFRVPSIQAIQEIEPQVAKFGSLDRTQGNVGCSYACIARKSPEPQKDVEVSVEKNQILPKIFTKDKKYPKEKAASLMECKKEPLPFKTASKAQKKNSKKFLKDLKECSPVKNNCTISDSNHLESEQEIVLRLCGSGSCASLGSSPSMACQEMYISCTSTPRPEEPEHSISENSDNGSYNRTTSESSTSSLDIEFEDGNISCKSLENACVSTSKHPNSILAHILGMDSESEDSSDDDDEESDDDWDNVTYCSTLVLDDSWETFGMTVNSTPKNMLPPCSKDSTNKGQSENIFDSTDSCNSCNLIEINNRWKREVMETVTPASPTRVRFGEVIIHPMITWSYAYKSARRGPWKQYASDRARFSRRISKLETVLNPVLESHHRDAMYLKLYG